MGNGVMDDFVPTNNINTVTNLNITSRGISDLTGIENFIALTEFNCINNQLTTLNLSTNVALTHLLCFGNQLELLDLSSNVALINIGCGSNQLESLDVSANVVLTMLECYVDLLESLDLSTNVALTTLECDDNQLESLNIANNNNTNFTSLFVNNNPNLTCVTVDNQTIADSWNNSWPFSTNSTPDTQTKFNTNCNAVTIEAKAYLQGAFLNPSIGEETFMRDDLRTQSLITSTSPYTDSASIIGTPFTTIGANAIVDWVWVELRDDTDSTQIIDGQSALLQRDGDIVGDGTSPIVFAQAAKYYNVVVNHRNHSRIISDVKQAFPKNQVRKFHGWF